jgi:hypothetical protein
LGTRSFFYGKTIFYSAPQLAAPFRQTIKHAYSSRGGAFFAGIHQPSGEICLFKQEVKLFASWLLSATFWPPKFPVKGI